MFPAERRRQVSKYVNEQGSIGIAELSVIFNVSEMTIHRDLDALERMGLIKKTRGGALASDIYHVPVDYRERSLSFPEEKNAVGRKAVEFIHNNDTILIDPGTTGMSIARHCRGFSGVTVYTNGPMIVLELAQIPGIEVYSTGGWLSKSDMAYVGPAAEDVISLLRPDKCFIGANGFSLDVGVTDPNPLEASIKRKMVEVSREVYLVITPDKLGRISKHISAPTQAIDVIILHPDSPSDTCADLAQAGIRCVLAEP